MSKSHKINRVVEIVKQAYELEQDLGMLDKFRVWWASRPRVQKRKARRAKRRAG